MRCDVIDSGRVLAHTARSAAEFGAGGTARSSRTASVTLSDDGARTYGRTEERCGVRCGPTEQDFLRQTDESPNFAARFGYRAGRYSPSRLPAGNVRSMPDPPARAGGSIDRFRPPTGVTCSDEEENNVRRARSLKLIAGLAAAGLALAACSSGSQYDQQQHQRGRSRRGRSRRRPDRRRPDPAAAAAARPPPGRRDDRRSRPPSSWAWPTTSAAAATSRSTTWRPRAWTRPRPPASPSSASSTAGAGEPDSAKVDRLNQLVDSGATDIIARRVRLRRPAEGGRRREPGGQFRASSMTTRWSTCRTSRR